MIIHNPTIKNLFNSVNTEESVHLLREGVKNKFMFGKKVGIFFLLTPSNIFPQLETLIHNVSVVTQKSDLSITFFLFLERKDIGKRGQAT